MTDRVTLRELKALLKRSPRLLAEYLIDRAQERLDEIPPRVEDYERDECKEQAR